MKRSIVLIVAGVLFVTGCNKTKTENNEASVPGNEVPATQRKCATQEVFDEQLKADPGIRERREQIEQFVRRVTENPSAYRQSAGGNIQIPVVVNVLYKTAAQNISQAQVESQITALNKDFSASNSDYNNVPNVFRNFRSGNIDIEFVLALPINRRETNKTKWQLNNAMKKSQQGGIDATNPTTMLNMWVCNLSSGYLGYSYYPGTIAPALDGVVIDDNAFGTTGSAEAPFDLGRTATHEVGHWLNLQHIWGDATCGTDLVADTPPHRTYNFGCPGIIPITCTNNSTTNPYGFPREMTMNYMDYTDDACMFMFSAGQKARMQAIFVPGGPRYSFVHP
ncbi:MAG: zinc metalloprotease [Chitinophagaceae bacterium]